jgi:hypothetical protein
MIRMQRRYPSCYVWPACDVTMSRLWWQLAGKNPWLHYHWCDLIMVKSLVVGQRKFTYLKKNKDVPNVAHDSNL